MQSPRFILLSVQADRQTHQPWSSTDILRPHLLNVRSVGLRQAYFMALHLQGPAFLGSTVLVQPKLFLLHLSFLSVVHTHAGRPACALCWDEWQALHAMQSPQKAARPRVERRESKRPIQ